MDAILCRGTPNTPRFGFLNAETQRALRYAEKK
jgi:hypothetical protein